MFKFDKYSAILGLVLLLFFILKAINIAPKISDENIWFYAAYMMSEGTLPYRDFFNASLPGQLIPLAILIKIFGFNLYLLKLVPILFSMGTAVLLYKMVSNSLSSSLSQSSPLRSSSSEGQASLSQRSNGRVLGIVAAALFLFSFTVLVTTDHGTGVHEATFFLAACWFFVSKKRRTTKLSGWPQSVNMIVAGLMLFAGLTVRTYIVPAVVGFSLFLLYQRRFKRLFLFGLSAAIPYLTLNGGLYILFGEKFYKPVWGYHFLKTDGIDKNRILMFFVQNEWIILAVFLAALVFVFNSRKFRAPNSILVGMASFGLLAQCIFLVIFRDLYYLYLVALIPFIAVLITTALNRILVTNSIQLSLNNKITVAEKALSVFVVVYVLVNSFNYLNNHAPVSVISNIDKIVADVQGLTQSNSADAKGFGETMSADAKGFGETMSADAGSSGVTLWGTFAVAPLVSLRTGIPITDNQVDSNPKRIMTGVWTANEANGVVAKSSYIIQLGYIDTTQKVSPEDPGKILKLDPDYISQHKLQDRCKLFRTYPVARDYDNNAILLWKCDKHAD